MKGKEHSCQRYGSKGSFTFYEVLMNHSEVLQIYKM